MSSRALLVLAVGLSVLLSSFSAPALAQDDPARPLGPPEAQPLADPPDAPAGDGTGVRLATDLGDIVIGLFTESAPVASENFINLVQAGYYDGVGFHRLVPGFVIQGGAPRDSGQSGPGYTIPDEPVVGRYGRGIVAMARTPAPDSQGSQFFIVLDDGAERSLDSERTYVIFGRVLQGMDVVDAIAAMPNAGPPDNAALDPVIITAATLEEVELPPEPEAVPLGGPQLAAAQLAGRFPATVGGMTLATVSFSADEILAQVSPEDPINRLADAVDARGKLPADLSIASATAGEGVDFVGILAATLEGVPAGDIVGDLTSILVRAGPEVVISDQVVSGRDIRRVEPGSGLGGSSPVYILVSGEIVWFVVAPEGALLEEVIGALP